MPPRRPPPGPVPGPSRRGFLSGAAVTALVALVGCSGGDATTYPEPSPVPPPGPTRPLRGRRNVVLISVDDLGWQQMGCYGDDFLETPEIDRMAAEGVRFTQAYAAAPICSPSRAALMTGCYPGRLGVTDFLRPEGDVSDNFLSADVTTVADLLGPRGYACGLVGKWHLTETYSGAYDERPGNPFSRGFDDVRVSEELYIGPGDYTFPYGFMPDVEARGPDEWLTDRLSLEVQDFVVAHRDQPFYLHVSNYAIHSELAARPELVEKYREKALDDGSADEDTILIAAMMESVDEQVGRLRRLLEQQGLADRTVVMITSDNGGGNAARNLPLRGGKAELYEGGIRVPLVVWGPGLVEEGVVSDLVTSGVDHLATAATLAGLEVPEGVDGVSLVPTLTGRGEQVQREATYWTYPHIIGRARPTAAVRVGDLKGVMSLRDGSTELYDIAADPGETEDLARDRPDDARRVRGLLDDHLAELDLYPGPPVARGAVERFDGDLPTGWDVVAVPGAELAPTEVRGGRLRITSDAGLGGALVLAPTAPTGDGEIAVVVEPGGLPGTNRERSLYAGLTGVVDGLEVSLLLRYRHDRGRIGLDLRRDGEVLAGGLEPTDQLDGTVDLSGDGARMALCLRGASRPSPGPGRTPRVDSRRGLGAAYVDQGRGWEFCFGFDVGDVLDLTDPAVRSGLRPAAGGRVDDGMVSIATLTTS